MLDYLEQLLAGHGQTLAESQAALGGVIELIHELSATEQDSQWHGEGDVAVHTSMVIDELESALAKSAAGLSAERALSLRLGALLHDIGKPLVTCTRQGDGRERIIAPHHATRGAAYLAYRLPELRLPPDVMFEVLTLVRHHHHPAALVRRDRPPRELQALARRVDPRQLYRLCLADMRGRRCQDKQEQLDLIELFRLGCEACGAWEPSDLHREFIDQISRHLADKATVAQLEKVVIDGLRDLEGGVIFTPEEAIARSRRAPVRGAKPKQTYPEVVVTCGPSGSGKSEWVARNVQGWEVISLDRLRREVTGKRSDQRENQRVFKRAREALKANLRAGRSLAWDATCLRRDVRQAVLETGRAYGAHTTLVVFCPPLSVIQQRNQRRDAPIPPGVLKRQLQSLEWPELAEAHRLLFVDELGDTIRDTRSWWMRRTSS